MDDKYPEEEILDPIAKEEEEQSYEDDGIELPPAEIVSFTEQRSCADLYRMYEKEQIIIKPDFQRDLVWEPANKTRFIDSLLKGLPIPSMCICFDKRTNKRIVIDGLQRISTIISFLSNDNFKLSKLRDIDPRISNKKVSEIKTQNPDIYELIENIALPVTVVHCNTNNTNHSRYLFTIFHRLNSGGSRLNNQEIRNCIYSGSLNNLLKEIADSQDWKSFINFNKKKKYRFSNEEMILRVFSFSQCLECYNGRLSQFLNSFMDDNKCMDEESIAEFRTNFGKVLSLTNKFLKEEDKLIWNKTIQEGFLYGMYVNIDTLFKNNTDVGELYRKLIASEEFTSEIQQGGLSDQNKVKRRLNKAAEIFNV